MTSTTPVGDTNGLGYFMGETAVSPDSSRLYAVTRYAISVIDTATNTVIATVPTAGSWSGSRRVLPYWPREVGSTPAKVRRSTMVNCPGTRAGRVGLQGDRRLCGWLR